MAHRAFGTSLSADQVRPDLPRANTTSASRSAEADGYRPLARKAGGHAPTGGVDFRGMAAAYGLDGMGVANGDAPIVVPGHHLALLITEKIKATAHRALSIA